MAKYRDNLPQLNGDIFLTDGGLETTLIFHEGLDLPYFAAFDLLKDDDGCGLLKKYFSSYAAIAGEHGVGSILESPTWRASQDWSDKLGYSKEALADMNRRAIELLQEIRDEYENEKTRIVISGCVGPRGEGYDPSVKITEEEAENYHMAQIKTFSESDADLVSAFTITHIEEAIGLCRAAKTAEIPIVISFTVETDGKLPNGLSLQDAVKRVDKSTDSLPAYYMINCAHPTHFDHSLNSGQSWEQRIHGIRANASKKSHAELDESETLDDGNPAELGDQFKEFIIRHHSIHILGGCCGTDHRHIEEIAKSCTS